MGTWDWPSLALPTDFPTLCFARRQVTAPPLHVIPLPVSVGRMLLTFQESNCESFHFQQYFSVSSVMLAGWENIREWAMTF